MGRLQQMGDTQTGGSIAGAASRAMPIVPNAIIVNVARITHDVVSSKWALSLSLCMLALGLCNRIDSSGKIAGNGRICDYLFN
jgi:hypothetical protein